MNNYFKLNSECYLILGKKKSVIHNLLTGEMLWINESNTKKLIYSEANNAINLNDYIFSNLLDMKWGKTSTVPIYIDKLRTINNFNQKKLWLDMQEIAFANIQITNVCNLNCSFCNKNFCPSCKINEDKLNNKSLSFDEWIRIIDDLIKFNIKNILFTGGEPMLYDDINLLLKYSLNKKINTSIHTNGLLELNNIPKEVNIIITLFDRKNFNNIIKINGTLENVTLIVQEKDFDDIKNKINHWNIVKTSNFDEGIRLSKDNLSKVTINNFFSKKLSDHCLKGKIAIAYNGDVYPCFGSNDKLLNLRTKNLSENMKILIKKYWNKSIEKDEERSKCIQCEFRFSCRSCKFVNINKSCKYNLEEGTWL